MNARQKYTQQLRRVSQTELTSLLAHARKQFHAAKDSGSCAAEAVCYWDLEQVKDEIKRRAAP